MKGSINQEDIIISMCVDLITKIQKCKGKTDKSIMIGGDFDTSLSN